MSNYSLETIVEKYESQLVFVGFLILITLMNLDRVTQLPVWDAATGLFPGALYLVDSGFDLNALMAEPTWKAGGPNNYSLSSWLWFTAAIIAISPDETAFIVLHVIHFGMTAAILVLIYRLARPVTGARNGLLICCAILVVPVFRVQTGQMYMEIPLSLFIVATVVSLSRGRHYLAAIFATLALTVKAAGLIAVVVFVVAVALNRSVTIRERAIQIGCVLVYPVLTFASTVAGIASGSTTSGNVSRSLWTRWSYDVWARFKLIPDVAIVVTIICLAFVVFSPVLFRWFRQAETDSRKLEYPLALSLLTVVAFVGFMVAVFLTGVRFWLLPRYFAIILPLAVFGVLGGIFYLVSHTSKTEFKGGATTILAVCFIAAGLVNSHGALYQPVTFTFSMLERDLGYQDALFLQQLTSEVVSTLPEDVPKYVPRPMYFFTQHPRLGYVDSKVPNIKFIYESKPESTGEIAQYPDHFFVVLSYPHHGGEILVQVVEEAERSGSYATRVFPVEHEELAAFIIEIRRLAPREKRDLVPGPTDEADGEY